MKPDYQKKISRKRRSKKVMIPTGQSKIPEELRTQETSALTKEMEMLREGLQELCRKWSPGRPVEHYLKPLNEDLCAGGTLDMKAEPNVKSQGHYTQFRIQPACFIAANNLGYFEGNVIKYVCRYNLKNGVEDLKKAQHYLEMLIEKLETGEVKL